ncbi:ribonuclease J [Actinomyces minihominis]|uniref:ribonuclease J n=1 Tax=Actinomyces minihominis TaxID=2002838 RepID=UPI000C077405|nr:ribonuclease J [Actinomyces minihominis]
MNNLYKHLSEPGPVGKHTLRVVPLGGLGEVGRNMTVLETKDKLLLIDCGVLFPSDHQPGVDLILPDFGYIADRLDDVVGLLLTHGHEDHIGAVPYLLKLRPDIPIYGSRLTLALVEAKLQEHRLPTKHLHVVSEGDVVQLAPFSAEFVAVNHSIPDALAIFVRTAAGTVLATGDFKMDQLPIDGRLTDLRSFARFGEEGVDLFLVDSTNAEVPGFVTSEVEIGPALEKAFEGTPGAIIVASFASHIHRVQQVLQAAEKTGRKVAFVGRSMERNMRIADELEYLDTGENVVAPLSEVNSLPRRDRVYMVTGSQGEPMAALGRIARGDHNSIEVGPGDTVVFASSLIPGNESSIYRVINDLTGLGAKVVHQGNAKVHVSGHASAGELLYCYNIIKPKNVLPVHGEIRHLVANGQLAVKTGVDPQNVVLAEGGVVIDLKNGKTHVAGVVPNELIYVDGSSIGDLSEDELAERVVLGSEGLITVYAVVDKDSGMVLSDPVVRAVGVAEEDEIFDEIRPELAKALRDAAAPGNVSTHRLQQTLRRTLGRWVSRRLRRRPVIVPIVVQQ